MSGILLNNFLNIIHVLKTLKKRTKNDADLTIQTSEEAQCHM